MKNEQLAIGSTEILRHPLLGMRFCPYIYTYPLGDINAVVVEYGLFQDHLACANPRVNNLDVRIMEADEAEKDEEPLRAANDSFLCILARPEC